MPSAISSPVKVEVGWPDTRLVFLTVSLSDAEFVKSNVIEIDIEVIWLNIESLS